VLHKDNLFLSGNYLASYLLHQLSLCNFFADIDNYTVSQKKQDTLLMSIKLSRNVSAIRYVYACVQNSSNFVNAISGLI